MEKKRNYSEWLSTCSSVPTLWWFRMPPILITRPISYDCRLVGLWFITPLSTIFSYIVAVSFIAGGNRRTRRKPPTCRKSLTNFYHITLNGVYPTSNDFALVIKPFPVIGVWHRHLFHSKIYALPLPYFKVNICPLPLPHFVSIFFAYLWSFRWPNYIVTLPRYFSFRLPPHLNIPTGTPSDELDKTIQRKWLGENLSYWNGYNHFRFALDFSYVFGIL